MLERKAKLIQNLVTISNKPVIEYERYEQWIKLVRVTAYVLRFSPNLKLKRPYGSGQLSAAEIADAENVWYRMIQRDTLPQEYERLKQGKAVQRNSRILKLNPYFDKKSRTLQVGGRLQNSDLPETTKHPIIVPHGHPLTEKIMNRKHPELLHAGPEMTLSALRQNIWLTKGRREVKRVINRCITCQRQRKSCSTQRMGQLPHERVSFSPPFTHVRVDFAGPLYVRDNTVKKTYVCIFTCASSCMVHLELTKDMSTSEFLKAFNHMIGRRGLCETM